MKRILLLCTFIALPSAVLAMQNGPWIKQLSHQWGEPHTGILKTTRGQLIEFRFSGNHAHMSQTIEQQLQKHPDATELRIQHQSGAMTRFGIQPNTK